MLTARTPAGFTTARHKSFTPAIESTDWNARCERSVRRFVGDGRQIAGPSRTQKNATERNVPQGGLVAGLDL